MKKLIRKLIKQFFKYTCLCGSLYGLCIYYFKLQDKNQKAYYLFISLGLYMLALFFDKKVDDEILIYHKHNVKIFDKDKRKDFYITLDDELMLNIDRMIRIQESYEAIEFIALKRRKISATNYKKITNLRDEEINELNKVKNNKLEYEEYAKKCLERKKLLKQIKVNHEIYH